jgi:hypothetical protein
LGRHFYVFQPEVAVFEIIEHGLGQAKFRYAVTQHAADFFVRLEDGHVVAVALEYHRDGEARGPRADDGGAHAVWCGGALRHLACVGGGNVILDHREMHRRAPHALHAVPLALVFVVAHQAAHGRQRIVFEQHPPRLVQPARLQQADGAGYIRMVWIGQPRLAEGIFAVEAVIGLVHHMQVPCL